MSVSVRESTYISSRPGISNRESLPSNIPFVNITMGKLGALALAAASLARMAAAATPDVLWTIRNFDFHASYIFTTPAHQNSWGFVNFTLTSNMVSYTTSCTANSNRLNDFFYGETAYACTPADEAPLGAAANFKFDRPSGRLYIEETFVQG